MELPFKRLSVAGGVLVLAAGAWFHLATQNSDANAGIRHVGPVITLSDGTTLTMETFVSDRESNVREIDYTIHGPASTSMVKIQYNRAWPDLISRSAYVADSQTGAYSTDTVVRTASGSGMETVTARSSLMSSRKHAELTVRGSENHHLTARLAG